MYNSICKKKKYVILCECLIILIAFITLKTCDLVFD